MFPKLFTPIKINKMEVRNRIFMPALGTVFSYDQRLSERHYNFYERRAQGGAGIVTAGPVGVDFIGAGMICISLAKDEYISDYKKLAEVVHRHGAKSMVQLFHAGRYTFSATVNGETPIAPSAVKSRYTGETPREMTLEEIGQVQEAFAQAARRAQEAGLDGVEIIGSAGYLISQFLSPVTNKRTDAYGGSFENRVRFPREVIEKVRAAVGPDFVVTIRVAGNDFVPGSNNNEDSARACQVFEQAGVNAINVTGGWHEAFISQLTMEVPRGAYAYLAAGIKKAVSIPVISSNRITDPFLAEQVLMEGMADLVSLGRVLVADPDWPLKAMDGRPEEIRPCIGCMQGCLDMIFTGQPLQCMVNPEAGFEAERQLEPASKSKKVIVVGGGVAGMEAARVAAMRGHQVDLYEKDDFLGGQLYLAAAPPGRDEFMALLDYYEAVLPELGVRIHVGEEITGKMLKRKKPEAIIVAEGAEQIKPSIPGIDGSNVVWAWDVLKGQADLGKKVAVIGGGAVGLETSLLIAKHGTLSPEALEFLFFNRGETDEKLHELTARGTREVTVVEMLPVAGQDVGKSSRWVLLKELRDRGVKVITHAKVTAIEPDGLVYQDESGATKKFACDSVVVAVGSRANRRLSQELEQLQLAHHSVGDCVTPRKVMDAVHEAFLAAKEV